MLELRINRIISNPNGTFGEFELLDDGVSIFSGCSCEPAGAPTMQSGLNRPICTGCYDAHFRHSPKFSCRVGGKKLPILSSDTLNQERCILIHAGNYSKDTQGCILLGEGFLYQNNAICGVSNSKKTIMSLLEKLQDRDFSVDITSGFSAQ